MQQMSTRTIRSDIALPDASEFYTHSKTIRRNAEVARAVYLHNMVGAGFRKIGSAFRRAADLVNYAQRMNQDARL